MTAVVEQAREHLLRYKLERNGTGTRGRGSGGPRDWSRYTLLIVASLPALAFLAVVTMLLVQSLPVLIESGIGWRQLLSTHYSGRFASTSQGAYYGLVPAAYGTLLSVCVAMAAAVPVSLALALLATEFHLGPISDVLEAVLGLLAGIPPILYALSSAVLARLVIVPKFAALYQEHATVATWPGMSWWTSGSAPNEQSTLLGGLLLALLVIPFMAPLFMDAVRGVPDSLREASWALGGSHWDTSVRVVLPWALPGMVSAMTLGALKAAGDVLIVGFSVGHESGLPNPLWDVFERVATLTSAGAGLAGGFATSAAGGGGFKSVENAVANTMGLLLLVLALGGVLGMGLLQIWLTRRLHGRE